MCIVCTSASVPVCVVCNLSLQFLCVLFVHLLWFCVLSAHHLQSLCVYIICFSSFNDSVFFYLTETIRLSNLPCVIIPKYWYFFFVHLFFILLFFVHASLKQNNNITTLTNLSHFYFFCHNKAEDSKGYNMHIDMQSHWHIPPQVKIKPGNMALSHYHYNHSNEVNFP